MSQKTLLLSAVATAALLIGGGALAQSQGPGAGPPFMQGEAPANGSANDAAHPKDGPGMMPHMGQGMGPGMMQRMGQGMGPGMMQRMGQGMGPGMMQHMGQGMGPGMMQRMGQGMGPGMMQHMGQGMGPGKMSERRGLIFADPTQFEALKSELGITPAQETAWTRYAKAAQDAATATKTIREGVHPDAISKMSPQDRQAFVTKMRERGQKQFEAVKVAIDELVAVLDDGQKTKARNILPGLASIGWSDARTEPPKN
jgi:hypothetical protein